MTMSFIDRSKTHVTTYRSIFADCAGLEETTVSNCKYKLNIDPKDKLSKLHLAVVNEELDKVRKYVQQHHDEDKSVANTRLVFCAFFRSFFASKGTLTLFNI